MNTCFRHPLAAALLLAFGHAGAAVITVDVAGDAHVSGHCTLREAIESANTHLAPTATSCVAGSNGGNTIAIPPSLSPIEIGGAALAIADSGGATLVHSTVTGTKVAVRRVSGVDAVFSASKAATFEDLAISGGHGGMGGGGVAGGGNTTVTLRRCLVNDNFSQYFSGGVTIDQGGTLNVIDTTVADNHSGNLANGGGIGVNLATLTLTGSTVSGNSAEVGGGIFAWSSTLAIHNSTVSGNTATDQGGGIWLYASAGFELIHATIAANAAPHGAGVRVYSRASAGTLMTVQSSLIWGNAGSVDVEHMGGADDILNGTHNLIGQISDHISYSLDTLHCDPQLQPLGWNGGPTWTHALPAGSCAVDAGGSYRWFNDDQRGAGHDRWIGTRVDIGAYEYDPNDHTIYDRIFATGFD